MGRFRSFIYPDIPPELSEILFKEDKRLVVVGVLGKSSRPDCNKMAGFQVLNAYASLHQTANSLCPQEGQITFYFEPNGHILYLHFVSAFDAYAMDALLTDLLADTDPNADVIAFNSTVRNLFARLCLFAIQVCHIIVLVEPDGHVFDASYLSIFHAMKKMRDKYVCAFLPKLLKLSNAGEFLGKDGRLCSPRFIFYFEKCLHEVVDNDALQKLEFDTEDKIYKMLRNEFIIQDNSIMSLFSIPRNKRFVFINANVNIRSDPVVDSIELLLESIEKSSIKDRDPDDDLEELRPFRGFGKPLHAYSDGIGNDFKEEPTEKSHSIVDLLNEHVREALDNGFDDSVAKYKGKCRFVIPTVSSWYETFNLIHQMFIENPQLQNFEANDPDYKSFLEKSHRILKMDERLFTECSEHGLELAIGNYNEMLPHHYSNEFHMQKITDSFKVLAKYARAYDIEWYKERLTVVCNEIWQNGRQQCEQPSLRGQPCIRGLHDDAADDHSSGFVYISTCNCGRTQGRRDDPYSIRQANYDFYQLLANQCSACHKLDRFSFAIFQPSTKDFRAANVSADSNVLSIANDDDKFRSPPLSQMENLTLRSEDDVGGGSAAAAEADNLPTAKEKALSDEDGGAEGNDDDDDDEIDDDDDDDERLDEDEDDSDHSVNEIVIKVGAAADTAELPDKHIVRQPSTTEYLPGMVHTQSPIGLLPQFPSWSLVCIGLSSVYSHNTGLPDHVQSGFLTATNFLLPWDVHVRLEHAASWAASYEKSRNRKKPSMVATSAGGDSASADGAGQVFVLKIFIGCEYECVRGHRFIMNSPDRLVRGGKKINKDSGNKVVFNDMPLYFPCPCRAGNNDVIGAHAKVAQLMRVHVVTPKAPVNVIIEPKVRVGGKNGPIFITGLPEPPKLTQSAYWVLRLPYVYHGDDGPILPPTDITAANAMQYGCLLAGMYGISETAAATSHNNNRR